jgi:hypothetical protein
VDKVDQVNGFEKNLKKGTLVIWFWKKIIKSLFYNNTVEGIEVYGSIIKIKLFTTNLKKVSFNIKWVCVNDDCNQH